MSQIASAVPSVDAARAPDLTPWNENLNPTPPAACTWTATNYATLQVSMVVSVPAYMLASGLMSEGVNWWQAMLMVFLGNLIVFVPMAPVGHAGTKYGIPFPVPMRALFGVHGAQLPAILRVIVACGWFGIQTRLGSQAIYTIPNIVTGSTLAGSNTPGLGINPDQGFCFLLLQTLHIWLVTRGLESIKRFQVLATPLLILAVLGPAWQAYTNAGGSGPMLSVPSAFAVGGKRAGKSWGFFWPLFTAMVGYWVTLAPNIPGFTCFARSQRDQLVEQVVGLLLSMGLLALAAMPVTSFTAVIHGQAIWDPVTLAGKMTGPSVVVALLVLITATLMTNIAANVVSSAYDFSNLASHRISFRVGGYITAGIGLATMPWKILEITKGYIFTWLVGYDALLGPVAGIMMVDYFLVCRIVLKTDELFRVDDLYGYGNGWNGHAIAAPVIGVLPNLLDLFKQAGFVVSVPGVFEALYTYAWFVGLAISIVMYVTPMCGRR